ncbi:MAG TPA: hypothetical protein PLT92_00340 [Ignavibacteriaceae bacterium]|jgi:tetratricopeptide (TPR) repeat protein|nr:hypothetical protein [Ignavibacteriaceae bacterium]HOJ16990.1 hypothetical protein [Ignavibacteriaceae bacterium]
MIKLIRSAVLFFFIFVLTSSVYGQSVQELITEGDNLATKQFNNEKALEKFLQAEKLEPKNFEILWRISRSYVDIAEHMPSSTDAQEEAQLAKYQLAVDYAEKAVREAPNKTITLLRRAIANGRLALFKGVFTAVGLVNKVKDDCEKAIKLNNGGQEVLSVAYYVLGRTHFKVCEKSYLVRLPIGLGWGDMDKAIANLKKSVELRPNFRMSQLELAKAYIEEDEEELAKKHLQIIPTLPVLDEDDAQFLKESKELLKKLN